MCESESLGLHIEVGDVDLCANHPDNTAWEESNKISSRYIVFKNHIESDRAYG